MYMERAVCDCEVKKRNQISQGYNFIQRLQVSLPIAECILEGMPFFQLSSVVVITEPAALWLQFTLGRKGI